MEWIMVQLDRKEEMRRLEVLVMKWNAGRRVPSRSKMGMAKGSESSHGRVCYSEAGLSSQRVGF